MQEIKIALFQFKLCKVLCKAAFKAQFTFYNLVVTLHGPNKFSKIKKYTTGMQSKHQINCTILWYRKYSISNAKTIERVNSSFIK